MIPLFSYLLKANIVLLLLYGFYVLCLRRDTFYGTIRWYLLAVLVAVVVFPLVDVSGWLAERPVAVEVAQYVPTVETVYQVYQYVVEPQPMEYTMTETVVPEKLSVGRIIFWCWLPVAAFLLTKRLLQLVSLAFLYFRSPKQHIGTQVIVAVARNIQPFSFAGRIFLNPSLYTEEELNEIITHERIHCRHVHSLDILFAELIVCLCWFNPAAWLLRNAIRQNLEYYTDRSVLRIGLDRKHYQYSLLRVSGNTYQIVNHFHINHLKKRIIMMNKKNSPCIVAVKYLLVVPALMAVLLVVQMSGLQAAEEYLPKDITNTIVESITDLKVHLSDGSSAVSSGKADEYIIEDRTEIQEQAVSNINGKNLVKEVTGSITDKDEFVPDSTVVMQYLNIQKNDGISDYRARQGVPLTQDGENDLTEYYKGKIDIQELRRSFLITKIKTGIEPLVIINDQIFDFNTLARLPVKDIENFSVIKDGMTALYGEKAKDGVVIVNTKNRVINKEALKVNPTFYVADSLVQPFFSSKNKPLILIDEQEVEKQTFSALHPDDIDNFLILKADAAIAIYGDKAKNGAIVVRTKGKK